jgi:hypothetical protein
MAIEGRSKNSSSSTSRTTRISTFNCSTRAVTNTTSVNPFQTTTFSHVYNIDTEYFYKLETHQRLPYLNRTLINTIAGTFWGRRVSHNCNAAGAISEIRIGLVNPSLLGDSVSYLPAISTVAGMAATKARIAASEAKVNLAQAFAERKQIENLLASTARRLAAAIRMLRHGNLTGALRALGRDPQRARPLRTHDVASQWLEIQYGWKPLLSDLFGAVKALEAIDGRLLYQAVGKAGDSQRATLKRSQQGATSKEFRDDNRSVVTRAKCFIDVTVSDSALLTAAQLGLTDPLTLVWELVPFSFVADWFLPVGDYLRGLSGLTGLSYLGGCTSVLTQSEWRVDFNEVPTAPTGREIIAKRYSQRDTVTRSSNVSPPGPALAFKNPFTFTHGANALALLYNTVAGVSVRR